MLVNDWYQTFLASRNLESPTSRPLYNYRVTDEEYASLKSALADYVGKFNFYQALNSMFSALFVLYASEWWRRYELCILNSTEVAHNQTLCDAQEHGMQVLLHTLKSGGRCDIHRHTCLSSA